MEEEKVEKEEEEEEKDEEDEKARGGQHKEGSQRLAEGNLHQENLTPLVCCCVFMDCRTALSRPSFKLALESAVQEEDGKWQMIFYNMSSEDCDSQLAPE